MITHIFIDGFRSLSNFNMEINPGLNILVGPNGSGKTSIISFFKFISDMTTRPVAEAISASGGAGAFFSKTGKTTFSRKVECELRGIASPLQDNPMTFRIKGNFQYSYRFVVSASPQFDLVSLSHQQIKLKKIGDVVKKKDLHWTEEPNWDLSITSDYSEDGTSSFEINKLTIEQFNIPAYIFAEQNKKKVETKENTVLAKLKEDVTAGQCLITMMGYTIREIYLLYFDFLGGDLLNIVPSEVKRAEDSSRNPGISSDGSGLAATLYKLQRIGIDTPQLIFEQGSRNVRVLDKDSAIEVYKQIQNLTRLVNPSIKSVTADNDPFDNILRLRVQLDAAEEELSLPFSSMSDGTVKWLALITAVLTYRTIFAIEEPENFLHPRMQQEIVKIMRDDAERRGAFAFVIMTTHSETLLNASLPSEIIVVSLQGGKTQANRPTQRKLLEKLIRDSGFGLGHFYLTGALEDA